MDISQFKNKNVNNLKTDKIIDDEIDRILNSQQSLAAKYRHFRQADDYKSLRPWLYRSLIDQEKCCDCPGYFDCPKGGRRGYYYDVDLKNMELVNKICPKKTDILKYKDYLIYGEDNYEDCVRIFQKLNNFRDDIVNPKTEFLRAVKEMQLAIKNPESQRIFYLQTPNENRQIISSYLVAYSLKLGYKTAVVDPSLRLNFFRLDNSQNDISELLNLQSVIREARIVFIDNFDSFKHYSTAFDNMVLPIVKAAVGPQKILVMNGEESLASSITVSSYGRLHTGLQKKLAETKIFSFDEPVLFDI